MYWNIGSEETKTEKGAFGTVSCSYNPHNLTYLGRETTALCHEALRGQTNMFCS